MKVSRHIAVFVFPFGSHATPMFNLVKRINASMPKNFAFSFFSTAESNSSIFSGAKDDEFANIKAYNVWDGRPKDYVFSGNALLEQIGMFINATPDNFVKALKVAEEDTGLKISCLLTDAFLWFAADLSEKIGVPWVPFWPAGSCSLCAHLHTDDIRNLITTRGFEGLSINDMPREVLDDGQSPFAHLLHNMALNLPRANAIVVNSFEEIDPAITADLKSNLKKVLNVSTIHLMDSSSKKTSDFRAHRNDECLEWLEKHDHASVVYIAFGSVCTPPPDEMLALAEALETCKIPFLWSLKDHARKNLPAGFMDRTSGYGIFVSWAPQVEILASGKVGVFVTHGGWISILESITCGVPLICRPFFGDHSLNSAMVEQKWRIGLRVKDGVFTQNGTVNAIKLILDGEKGKEIKENVKLLKELAMDALKTDGSSMRNFQKLLELITKSF